MAIPWYLMCEPLYGEEDNTEGFQDILDSGISIDVEIFNYDLSEHWPTKAVISNRIQDTKLNSLTRTFFVPCKMAKAGQYVKYDNRYWLIENNTDDNTVYTKLIGRICNVKLMWINDEGDPIVRWATATNATQYNNGETNNKYFYFRSDQLMVEAPDDDETLKLNNRVRMVLDKRTGMYEKTIPEDCEFSNGFELVTYRITRMDNVVFDYIGQGVSQFMFTQDEQQIQDGFYRIKGEKYWLCEKPHIVNDEPYTCEIICEDETIYVGYGETIFNAQFDKDDNTSVTPIWAVNCDFVDKLTIIPDGDSIAISTNDKSLRGKMFQLILSADNYTSCSIDVNIKSFY